MIQLAVDLGVVQDVQVFAINAYIILGLLGGAIAKAILSGKRGGGFVKTSLLGIAGAPLAALLGQFLFDSSQSGILSITGLPFSVLDALLILVAYGYIAKKRHNQTKPETVEAHTLAVCGPPQLSFSTSNQTR